MEGESKSRANIFLRRIKFMEQTEKSEFNPMRSFPEHKGKKKEVFLRTNRIGMGFA